MICVVVHAVTVALAVRDDGLGLLDALWSVGGASVALESVGALLAGRVWVDGEWWRVVTTGVVHGSVLHLGLNLWSLWVVGPWCERAFGRAATGAVWLLSSVLGVLASLAWAEAAVVVGASAGIVGLAGAILTGRWLGRATVSEELQEVSSVGLVVALGLLVALGAFVPVIAQAGHLGGLAGGLLLGGTAASSWGTRLGCGLGFALATVGIGDIARAPTGRAEFHLAVGLRLLEQKGDEAALESLERALALAPDRPELANAVAYGLALRSVELERGVELVEQALAADPNSADFLDTLGWLRCKQGDTDAGMAALGRAQEAAEREIPEIEAHLERCHAVQGRAG